MAAKRNESGPRTAWRINEKRKRLREGLVISIGFKSNLRTLEPSISETKVRIH